jgi:cell division transport system permease protein
MAKNEPGLGSKTARWFKLHMRNCGDALRELGSQPIATLLTVMVIGVALALPGSLNLLVQNGRNLAGGWESARDFSIYMSIGSAESDAESLAEELRGMPLIEAVDITLADEALEEFRETSGLGDVLNMLESNPLPHTLVVRPTELAAPDELAALGAELIARDSVDLVKIDTQWVARLNAILDFLNRIVIIASVLLITAVIIIVGNTIRLDIQSRRDEIEVVKLLGASDGFVRRPFLYVGLWYGLIGGAVALLLLFGSGWLLTAPLERLIGLYETDLQLLGLDRNTILAILGGGVLAGWGGAWTAVARHLSAIQPR